MDQAVFDQLRTLAAQALRRERRGHTHQPTSLASEAFLRLGAKATDLDRSELIGLASRAIRQVLVDHARRRIAQKRGGAARRVPLTPESAVRRDEPASVLGVDEALTSLARIDPALAEIVELRYFGGLDEAQAAAHLGVSVRTVSRRWQVARMYLARALSQEA